MWYRPAASEYPSIRRETIGSSLALRELGGLFDLLGSGDPFKTTQGRSSAMRREAGLAKTK